MHMSVAGHECPRVADALTRSVVTQKLFLLNCLACKSICGWYGVLVKCLVSQKGVKRLEGRFDKLHAIIRQNMFRNTM